MTTRDLIDDFMASNRSSRETHWGTNEIRIILTSHHKLYEFLRRVLSFDGPISPQLREEIENSLAEMEPKK